MALSQEQKNLLLAEEVFSQLDAVIRDFVRENIDGSMSQRAVDKQYNTVMDYISQNIGQLEGNI